MTEATPTAAKRSLGLITYDRNAYRFRTEVRVRLSETDAVGIVYFGSFATYMDVGRMDYLNNLGLTRHEGAIRDLIPGAVVHYDADFIRPARYNDILEVNVRIAAIGRTSYTFHFLIADRRSAAVVATGRITLAWLDEAFQPQVVPAAFIEEVSGFEGENLTIAAP
jgi:acyl-CoA thioester hydrolase